MNKVILYIALTLDGYIADVDHKYNFLNKYGDIETYDFKSFIDSVDTIIMGRKSYDILRKDKWLYKDKTTYVYTRNFYVKRKYIKFTTMDPNKLINKIKENSTGNIWLFGGSEIFELFKINDLIDEYRLYYVPEVLSSGIPLFQTELLNKLKITSVKQIGNLFEVVLIPKDKVII